jgi:hypothetical protein
MFLQSRVKQTCAPARILYETYTVEASDLLDGVACLLTGGRRREVYSLCSS